MRKPKVTVKTVNSKRKAERLVAHGYEIKNSQVAGIFWKSTQYTLVKVRK